MAKVRLEATAGTGKPWAFESADHDVVLFGRSAQCHCSVPGDPFLSKNHFVIELSPPHCALRDLGSTNGTCVNGARLEKAGADGKGPGVELKHGDLITAGTLNVRIIIEDEQPLAPGPTVPDDSHTWTVFPGMTMLKELAAGGMGKVFLVRLAKGGRMAVLKTMTPDATMDEEKRKRYFFREIECTKGLRHPNIVTFLDGRNFEGIYYFLLEYCDQGSVCDLMQKLGGRIPLTQAAPLMLQALDALEFAHSRDIVHRDLKPGNLLLSSEGGTLTAKISDFGLAKDFRLAGMSGVTEINMAAGTLSFAPREQLLNFRYTLPTSDIFSLGATFYNMLTGDKVYDFDPDKDPLEVVLEGHVVPLLKRDPAFPEKVAAVIDRAVSVEPADRQATAAVFKAELAAALAG
jgi:hypothetical protein